MGTTLLFNGPIYRQWRVKRRPATLPNCQGERTLDFCIPVEVLLATVEHIAGEAFAVWVTLPLDRKVS
jgi:hypothetical protein